MPSTVAEPARVPLTAAGVVGVAVRSAVTVRQWIVIGQLDARSMDTFLTSTGHAPVAELTRIAELGTIVTVWAHPDDESYVAGGLMAMARHLGGTVTCVTATDGDLATTVAERRRVGAVRRHELGRALDLLDVTDRVRLGLPDGGCDDIDDDAGTAMIGDVLRSRRPDTVVTFGPDGLTGHPDHRAVARWTAAAVRSAAPGARLLCPALTREMADADRDINERFDVYAPGLPAAHDRADLALDVTLSGHWLDLKLAALRAHHSQTAGIIDAIGLRRYRSWVAREPFIDVDRY